MRYPLPDPGLLDTEAQQPKQFYQLYLPTLTTKTIQSKSEYAFHISDDDLNAPFYETSASTLHYR